MCAGTTDESSEVERVSSTITLRDRSHVSGVVAEQVRANQLSIYHQVQANEKG